MKLDDALAGVDRLGLDTPPFIFPVVPLAEITRPISRPVDVIPGQAYRTIGVKWWGEGAYERETIDGSQTAAISKAERS